MCLIGVGQRSPLCLALSSSLEAVLVFRTQDSECHRAVPYIPFVALLPLLYQDQRTCSGSWLCLWVFGDFRYLDHNKGYPILIEMKWFMPPMGMTQKMHINTYLLHVSCYVFYVSYSRGLLRVKKINIITCLESVVFTTLYFIQPWFFPAAFQKYWTTYIWSVTCVYTCASVFSFEFMLHTLLISECLVTCDKLIGKSTQEKCLLTEKHKVHHETDISHGFGLLTLLLVANSRHVHASWCWSTWSITQEYCQQLWRHQKAIVALQVGMDTYEKNEPKWATLLIVLRTQQLMSAERKEENGRHHIVYEKTC